MTRHFIAIAALSLGGFAFTAASAETMPDPEQIDFGDREIDPESVVLVEVEDTASYDLGATNGIAELRINSTATHLDVAGVERTAAGRPVDAPPGSMDAAQTGMQHDARGTVTNTVSTEPTPSAQVAEALAKNPDLQEQPAPTEDVAEEENKEE